MGVYVFFKANGDVRRLLVIVAFTNVWEVDQKVAVIEPLNVDILAASDESWTVFRSWIK